MRHFELQGVVLPAPAGEAFDYLADPSNLPSWTQAFTEVREGRALMRTPTGEVEVELRVDALRGAGTVDWRMTFPDGAVASAFSRVVPLDGRRSVYCFVLTPPPAALEALEGALDAQAAVLREELERLREILADG
jgi:hypothetical protein